MRLRQDQLCRLLRSRNRPSAHSYGTVGVVALDRAGNIAAGTSTGGLQGKMPGRVGDSPIIGAGTYASNQSCAVSATGAGEYFIRLGVAREVCNLVAFKGMHACSRPPTRSFTRSWKRCTATAASSPSLPTARWPGASTRPGMFRARQTEGGKLEIGIYSDEP